MSYVMSPVVDAGQPTTREVHRLYPHGSLFARWRHVVHARAILVDSLLVVALVSFSTLWLASSPLDWLPAALLQVALIVPLVWRRSQPSAVFVVTCGVAFSQWLLGYELIGDVALLVALYTVAAHESWVRSTGAAVVLEVGAVMAAARWEPAGPLVRSFLFLSATVVAAFFAGVTVASGSTYLAWLGERAERLEIERDQQSIIATTAERTRIAREMHDIVSHSLSVVITLADGASAVSGTDPTRAADAMAQVSEVGRHALADMRTMIGVLRTSEPTADLAPQPDLGQLEGLIDRFRAAGLAVDLRSEGTVAPLGEAVELTVYRLVQEALTNTLEHARARRASVSILYGDAAVEVRVDDDGVGAGEGLPPSGGVGHGIGGMRERATLHGGWLRAGPRAGGGWAVAASLPIAHLPATTRPVPA
jgi:signal transduction histidine kinase